MAASKTAVIVLDLDETIGHFPDAMGAVDAAVRVKRRRLTKQEMFRIFDSLPELFRPGILKVLEIASLSNECSGIYMYTNNRACRSWADTIALYLEEKLGKNLFSRVIAGPHAEKCRKGGKKTIEEFRKCSGLGQNTRVMFIDDQAHEGMIDDYVLYLNPTPFVARLPTNTIAKRVAAAVFPDDKRASAEIEHHLGVVLGEVTEESGNYDTAKAEGEEIIRHTSRFLSH